MNDQRLGEIEAREQAATIGPWEHIRGQGLVNGEDHTIAEHMDADDAEFIAHASEDIPALFAEVRRLRAERGSATECDDCHRSICSRCDGIGLECEFCGNICRECAPNHKHLDE